MLEPDRDQIEQFVNAIFRHAGSQGFVAVRSFLEGNDKPFRLSGTALTGGLRFLIDVAEDDARRAAQHPRPVVFCPPLAIFSNKDRARKQDIAEGLALSVECDEHPQEARETLEKILGPATVVVKSGGRWTNGNGKDDDKLHVHWRLARPARDSDLAKLKQGRDLAARIVGATRRTSQFAIRSAGRAAGTARPSRDCARSRPFTQRRRSISTRRSLRCGDRKSVV